MRQSSRKEYWSLITLGDPLYVRFRLKLRSMPYGLCRTPLDECRVGLEVKAFSILTTTPNVVTATVHDRMPVILHPDDHDLWLDPGRRNVAAISELLKPFDARLMRCYPVSTRINHVANDDEERSTPVELAQNRLF